MTPQSPEYEFGGTAEQRLEKLIFYAVRHGNILSHHATSIEDIRARLLSLEEDRQRRAVQDARTEERDKALLAEMEYVKKSLNALKGVLNKAVAIIFGAILLAVVKWVLEGGLSGVGS